MASVGYLFFQQVGISLWSFPSKGIVSSKQVLFVFFFFSAVLRNVSEYETFARMVDSCSLTSKNNIARILKPSLNYASHTLLGAEPEMRPS